MVKPNAQEKKLNDRGKEKCKEPQKPEGRGREEEDRNTEKNGQKR